MIHIPFERRGFIPTLPERPSCEDRVLAALGSHPKWEERDLGQHLEGVTKFVDVDVDGSTIIVGRTTGICRDRQKKLIVAWFDHTLWERMIIHEIRHRLHRGDYGWSGSPPERYVCGDPRRVVHLQVSSGGWTHDVWLWQDTGLATHAATGIYLAWLDPERIAAEVRRIAEPSTNSRPVAVS
ncbi:MAG: hypothetical protein HY341_02475 [Candidatus Kerfeldbacteria bacterium]|nr:hypothetical protein [Candidatus Kerfeldbacteria bacterium]